MNAKDQPSNEKAKSSRNKPDTSGNIDSYLSFVVGKTDEVLTLEGDWHYFL